MKWTKPPTHIPVFVYNNLFPLKQINDKLYLNDIAMKQRYEWLKIEQITNNFYTKRKKNKKNLFVRIGQKRTALDIDIRKQQQLLFDYKFEKFVDPRSDETELQDWFDWNKQGKSRVKTTTRSSINNYVGKVVKISANTSHRVEDSMNKGPKKPKVKFLGDGNSLILPKIPKKRNIFKARRVHTIGDTKDWKSMNRKAMELFNKFEGDRVQIEMTNATDLISSYQNKIINVFNTAKNNCLGEIEEIQWKPSFIKGSLEDSERGWNKN